MRDIMHIREYCEEVKERLGWSTIGFVRIKAKSAEDSLLGSGTLVSHKGKHAILTAAHVVEKVTETREIGLCLQEDAHRLVIATSLLKETYIGWSGHAVECGPDLALIELPSSCTGTLKARKAFYELSHMVDGNKVRPIGYDAGIFLSAFVGEWTQEGPPEAGFDATKAFGMLCGGVGRAERYWKHGDFDFCNISVQCHRDNPTNYHGASGGGFWKVIAASEDPQVCEVKKAILCGVAYWQTELTGDRRLIYCHAYESIYANAPNALS